MIRIQSTESQGQLTVRICTHDPHIEALVARDRKVHNIAGTPPDALNGPLTNGNMANEKRPAEDPASLE